MQNLFLINLLPIYLFEWKLAKGEKINFQKKLLVLKILTTFFIEISLTSLVAETQANLKKNQFILPIIFD